MTCKLIISRHVIFDEGVFSNAFKPVQHLKCSPTDLQLPSTLLFPNTVVNPSLDTSPMMPRSDSTSLPLLNPSLSSASWPMSTSHGLVLYKFVCPNSCNLSSIVVSIHPMTSRSKTDSLKPTKVFNLFGPLTPISTPTTLTEAQKSAHWQATMEQEISTLHYYITSTRGI